MIVKQLQLGMMPQVSRIAARHAHHMRHMGHLGGEQSGHPIGLQIMRINDVERPFGMRPRRRGGELGDERAGHGNVGLRAVDRVGPVHGHRTGTMRRYASLPVLRAHQHPERRNRLLGVGHHMNLMAERGEAVCAPIGPHADAALYRREFADDADSQSRTSMSPCAARSQISLSASGVEPSVDRSVYSSMAASPS